tara:strand:+ start:3351 stop:3989 length:639 start_codon:yes stop_codon:yes gene_type:complete
MFTMDSTYIVNLGFTLLIAGIITYYFRQQLETANHKISSMFSIVSSLTQEVNNLKKTNIPFNSSFNTNNLEDNENLDDRIPVPNNLETKKINITENSDDEDSDEDSDEDDDSSEEEDEEEEQENGEENDEEDYNVIKEESVKVIKDNNEEELMNLEDVVTTDIKEITLSEDNMSNDLANMTVPELKKLVSEKKLVSNVKSLKKQELIDLLSK